MRFWSGLVLSLLGGLVGIGIFREWIKLNFPGLDDSILDIVSVIVLIIVLIITAFAHLKQSKDLKNIEVEQKGRIIELKQKKNLLNDLKNIEKIKVMLTGIQGDRESIRFANSIKNILVEAKWEVEGVWEDIIIGGVGFGITIRESSSDSNSIGKIMNEIMNKNQIKSRIIFKADLETNCIEIIVGSRP
ncbi:hypothetical protein K8354_07205 [Polaribacter litorisediminis]|uniref:hypothetical protein n=1 Tax=Polaribacter litorisediminis TaxID=1908341 RepID=UPI001CBFCFBD|nr:hypothetical protein [Polaribacter litorisediminis]UAM99583.1 hypothetical protein K8354_07205 [Polaribacter litorisediminis]